MAKLKDVLFGKPRREPCSVPSLDGTSTLDFALRLLTGEESRTVELQARKVAGTNSPKPEDALYQHARMVGRLMLACIDKDVENADEPFFANEKEVLQHLDDARITYVYFEQLGFQTKHAPPLESVDYEDFIRLTWASVQEAQKGGDPERPFVGLPYRKLTSFAARSAAALTSPALPQLLFGSPTTPGAAGSPSSASSSESSSKPKSSTPTPTESSSPSTPPVIPPGDS